MLFVSGLGGLPLRSDAHPRHGCCHAGLNPCFDLLLD
jgi:hypothetical protein